MTEADPEGPVRRRPSRSLRQPRAAGRARGVNDRAKVGTRDPELEERFAEAAKKDLGITEWPLCFTCVKKRVLRGA